LVGVPGRLSGGNPSREPLLEAGGMKEKQRVQWWFERKCVGMERKTTKQGFNRVKKYPRGLEKKYGRGPIKEKGLPKPPPTKTFGGGGPVFWCKTRKVK